MTYQISWISDLRTIVAVDPGISRRVPEEPSDGSVAVLTSTSSVGCIGAGLAQG